MKRMLQEGESGSVIIVYDAKCKPVRLPHPLWQPAKIVKVGGTEVQKPDPPKRHALMVFVPGTHDGVDEKSLCALRDMLHSTKKSTDAFGKVTEVDSPFFARVIDPATKTTEPALVEVYAVSVESPFANRGIVHRGKLPFPIYSDYAREACRAYPGTDNHFALMPNYEVSKRTALLIRPDDVCAFAWRCPAPGLEIDWDDVRKTVISELKAWNLPKEKIIEDNTSSLSTLSIPSTPITPSAPSASTMETS